LVKNIWPSVLFEQQHGSEQNFLSLAELATKLCFFHKHLLDAGIKQRIDALQHG